MKLKLKLLFLSLFLSEILSAQTFIEAPSVFANVVQGSVAFSDIDGDNDQDVLITGNVGAGQVSILYKNDGDGNFTEVPDTPFEQLMLSAIAFSDVDGDNDPDLIITGSNYSIQIPEISKLYLNDGDGNFTEMLGPPFEPVSRSAIAFSDVDGDNDQDILITGSKEEFENEGISKLYLNDGDGNFTEMLGTPFDGVWGGAIAFSDVDGDNDPDVLITGDDSSDEGITKLYLNDGDGNFTEVLETPFSGFWRSSIAFSDVDSDNDQDVLMTGSNPFGFSTSKLYKNDGQGNFTEVLDIPFANVLRSAIAFADVDGDNDQDVLITGEDNATPAFERITKLYLNETVVSTDNVILGFDFELIPYPNPTTSNLLIVDLPAEQTGFDLAGNGFVNAKIYDFNGQLLMEQKAFPVVGPQTISVDISALSTGSYFIQLGNGKRKGVAKFIVP